MTQPKDLYPLGSVVLLEGAEQPLMIIGVLQYNEQKGELFDYLAVPFPQGYVNDENNFLFNQDNISEVIFRGFENKDTEAFEKMLELFYELINNTANLES